MKASRIMALVTAALLAVTAVGCSSTKEQVSSASSPPALSADDKAFCAGFNTVASLVGAGGSSGEKDLAAKFKDVAKKIRDNAPSDLADSARAYADLLDATSHDIAAADSPAAVAQAIAAVDSSPDEAIVPVVSYAASTCPTN